MCTNPCMKLALCCGPSIHDEPHGISSRTGPCVVERNGLVRNHSRGMGVLQTWSLIKNKMNGKKTIRAIATLEQTRLQERFLHA